MGNVFTKTCKRDGEREIITNPRIKNNKIILSRNYDW